ncbi:signal peptidase I [Candidatus Dependentiae bacterium]|nr:signal peptidase I [Candidatus Dependentiae bacterium]
MNIMKKILGSWYEVRGVREIAELLFVVLPIAFLIRTVGFGLYQVPSGSMETTLLVGERFFSNKISYWLRSPKRGEIIAFNDPNHTYSSNFLMNLFQRYANLNVTNVTKRVIGIPGDHVQGKIEEGHPVVYLNGKKLDESAYVNKYPLIWIQKAEKSKNRYGGYERENELRSFDPSLSWETQKFYKINPQLIIRNTETMQPRLILNPGTPLKDLDIFDVKLDKNQYWMMGDNRLGSSDSRVWGVLDGTLIHGKIVFRIWSMDTTESYWFIDLLKHPLGFWKKVRWERCFQPVH